MFIYFFNRKNKMNILLTAYNSLGHGGAEISTKLLAEKFKEFGHKAIIASSQEYPGIDTKIFKRFKIPFYEYNTFYLTNFLRKVIKEENIDIVYPQDRLTAIAAIKAAKKENIKVIPHFRDFWFACPRSSCLAPDNSLYDVCSYKTILKKFPRKRLLWDLYKWNYTKRNWKVIEKADAKFVNIRQTIEKLNLCGIKENIHIIPVARDLRLFENVDGSYLKKNYNFNKNIVTFVGKILKNNGIDILIKIIPMVLKENKEITFLIIGDGDMMDNLKSMIRLNNLESNVILTGRVPLEKVVDFLDISDMVILPQIWKDSFAAVFLEAGAMRKPVIISDIGAVQDMKEEFKLLVKPFDYNGWKEAILKLVNDKNLRKRLGKNGRKMVEEKYSIDIVARKIEKVFKKVLSEKNGVQFDN